MNKKNCQYFLNFFSKPHKEGRKRDFFFFHFFFFRNHMLRTLFDCLLFNLMPSRRSAPPIDHCSLSLPPSFSVVFFPCFIFLFPVFPDVYFILSRFDSVQFSSIKTLILHPLFPLSLPVSTVFLCSHILSLVKCSPYFCPTNKTHIFDLSLACVFLFLVSCSPGICRS